MKLLVQLICIPSAEAEEIRIDDWAMDERDQTISERFPLNRSRGKSGRGLVRGRVRRPDISSMVEEFTDSHRVPEGAVAVRDPGRSGVAGGHNEGGDGAVGVDLEVRWGKVLALGWF